MKRFFILILVGVIAGASLFAEEAFIIDFSTLDPGSTEINFSTNDGTEVSVSLAIEEWEVMLNSSARSVANQSISYTRLASVSGGEYQGDTVMGVRVRFPVEPFNAWALVKPPFEIPEYYGQGGGQFDGAGVLKNVGVIKEIQVNAYGLNFPHGLSIVIKDQDYREREYFLGNLEFDGWRTLVWQNPAYIEDVRNRELRKYPLYPNLAPSAKLMGFRIYRDASKEGGDFVTYIKDVNVIYDRALIEVETDIDDEAIWGIIEDRSEARNAAQTQRLGETQLLRALEEQKKHQEDQQ